jgi:cbb3-type cytochrome oxidase subunit 1
MDWFAKVFIRASLIWFVLGITLGLMMAIHPAWTVYGPAHAHMNLVGFVTMMIFGVGYQMLPRFFGHPIHSRGFAIAHIWLANIGLVLLVTGFFLAPHIGDRSIPVTAGGGALWAVGAYGFVYNMWRTFNAAERRKRLNQGREL